MIIGRKPREKQFVQSSLPGVDWKPYTGALCPDCFGLGRTKTGNCDTCEGRGVIARRN